MNKNFLITGATSGLGKEFCLLIADIAKGIVIVGRNKNKIIKLEKKINKLNPKIKVLPIVADLSKNKGLKKIFEIFAKQKKIKSIDVLVNSAANFTVKKIKNITIKEIQNDFQLNVFSPFMLSKYFGMKMKKKNKGIIFNIGSSSAYDCSEDTSIYCSTKHALLGINKAFNAELKSHGVKSIFIAPGSMQTPMGRKVKNQDYYTFIPPVEVAKFMKNILNCENKIHIDELKIKRNVYK